MNNCKIEIFTITDEEETRRSFIGKMQEMEGKYSVEYEDGEDDVCLSFDNSCFFMERSEQLKMNFLPFKQSKGDLFLGNQSAEMDIFTSRYVLNVNEVGIKVRLEYELMYPNFSQKFKLKIFIRTK